MVNRTTFLWSRLIKKGKGVFVLVTLLASLSALAHPGSGIVVDRYGNIYFVHSGKGVAKLSPDGKLTYVHPAKDGHWLCLDEAGIFSRSKPLYFERITPDGVIPALLYAGGGSPIIVNRDGYFYYCGGPGGELNPGALSLVRESPGNQPSIFCPDLEHTLADLHDGITGIAAGPDSSIYLACWNSLLKVNMDGQSKVIVHPVNVADCDEDPADHKEANRGIPLLRGLALDDRGIVYAAATSCHCVIKITPDGQTRTILKTERPWSPTGVAVHEGVIYVLEYTHANGPASEGWTPRVQKLTPDGKVSTITPVTL